MIFINGFVHCDPHPGNVLINAITEGKKENDFEIVLLDHGLYQVSRSKHVCGRGI
jgi:aarF domain-containing kinase